MEISALMGLPGEQDRAKAMKKVAGEMEAEFINEMLKEMRKSTDGSFFGKGPGADTFASMFDMEIARTISERGIGLQDLIVKGMMKYEERANEAKAASEAANVADIPGSESKTTPAKSPSIPNGAISNNIEITHNPLKTNGNNVYTLQALKFSGPSADKSTEKLSWR